jgi:hypothetical protein
MREIDIGSTLGSRNSWQMLADWPHKGYYNCHNPGGKQKYSSISA